MPNGWCRPDGRCRMHGPTDRSTTAHGSTDRPTTTAHGSSNRSAASAATTTTSSSTPVLSVGGGRDHRCDYETSRRDTKADCKHGDLSTRPGRLLQRAGAFLVRPLALLLK